MSLKRKFTYGNRTFVAYCGFDGRYIVDVNFFELKPNRKIFKYKYFGSKSFLLSTEEGFTITDVIQTKLAELLALEKEEDKLTKIRDDFKKGIDI